MQITQISEQSMTDIGIFGMDINIVLERPGHRVSAVAAVRLRLGCLTEWARTSPWSVKEHFD